MGTSFPQDEVPFFIMVFFTKKIILTGIILLIAMVSDANAELKVTCDVEVLSEHELTVTLGWKVTVISDKKWDACDLIISFRNKGQVELFQIKERMELKRGNNQFTGYDICEIETWKQVKKYVTSFDCVF